MAQPGAQIQTQLIHPPQQAGGQAQQQAGGQAQQQAQPAGQQQQAAQPAHINVNGALKGNPPTLFDGTHSKSLGFLVAFNLFRAANRHNEAMSNPYSRVTTALTYMTGDVMEPWKEDQLNLLNARIATGYQDNDEQLWNLFEADFRQAFTNTHKAKDAQRELKNLSQKDNLDTYISDFKRLARDSGYPLNDVGTIELFKRGLKKGLFDTIIDSDVYNPTTQNPWDFEHWTKEAIKQHGKWKEKVSFKDNYRTGLYKTFGVKRNPPNNRKRTTSQGGHYMDVDAVCLGQNHSEEKIAKLKEGNQCFYCEIRGHRAKDCRKKAADRAKQSSRSAAPQVKAAKGLTPEELTKFIQENMDSFQEETKISVIEALMPKDFVQGPN